MASSYGPQSSEWDNDSDSSCVGEQFQEVAAVVRKKIKILGKNKLKIGLKPNTTRYSCHKHHWNSTSIPKFWRFFNGSREYSIRATKIKYALINAARRFLTEHEIPGEVYSCGLHRIAIRTYKPRRIRVAHIFNFRMPNHPDMPFENGAIAFCTECGNRPRVCYSCMGSQEGDGRQTEKHFADVATDIARRKTLGLYAKTTSPRFEMNRTEFSERNY
jgi:hypothetical protein